MDTTELINNALYWANKRLSLQGEPLSENQINYINFALRMNMASNAIETNKATFEPEDIPIHIAGVENIKVEIKNGTIRVTPNEKYSFSEKKPNMGDEVCICWEDGSECDGIYDGLDESIKPLPTHWYYI